jgi:hypothetical protein
MASAGQPRRPLSYEESMSQPKQGPAINLWRGNPFAQTFRFKDGAGVGLDLTGRDMRLFMRFDGPPVVEIEQAWTLADQTQTATRGQASIALTKAEVLGIAQGKGRYEIEIDDTTILYGEVIVRAWAQNNA